MVSTNGRDKSRRATSAAAKPAVSRPSPAEKFDVDRTASATRVGNLKAQQQRSQKLHEYLDESVAQIRASLERP